ncbi:hypothetical protein BV22DRAFT_1029125 [Leucogyrophana mollusca]|uniref:Uncharacterized protein n=1 Tax=Leucogyrophana mollusca TaxID=85980 RepID=A0ACB8BW84_9AGAM|nr:hypothetical protein BV22DRAFT_1029125 [Leucogyrophana mollusca]
MVDQVVKASADQVAKASAGLHVAEVSFVSITLIIYDHVITLQEEVEYFWSGPWTISRVLYLTIRYLALALALSGIYVNFAPRPTTNMMGTGVYIEKMDPIALFSYVLVFVIILLCQGVVALRVWYLFSRNRFVRTFAVTLYLCSITGSITMACLLWSDMKAEFNAAADLFTPSSLRQIWMLYLPCIVVHSVLFLCKIYRVTTSHNTLRNTPLLGRMLKEGSLMYCFATGSLLFSIIGLADVSNMDLYMPALLCYFAVAAIVVSVCRAMISIRSLATMWHVDPEWLLNHAELSRVHWKKGNNGDLLVELGSPGTDDMSMDAMGTISEDQYSAVSGNDGHSKSI